MEHLNPAFAFIVEFGGRVSDDSLHLSRQYLITSVSFSFPTREGIDESKETFLFANIGLNLL